MKQENASDIKDIQINKATFLKKENMRSIIARSHILKFETLDGDSDIKQQLL